MTTNLQPVNVYEVVQFQERQFNQVISTDEINWKRESQFAIQALQNNEYLNEAAWKNQTSLQNAIINIAAIGITLNPAAKHAYLVPRDKSVCLDISYIGLMHIAMQSGSILWGQAKLVYFNDIYINNGIDKSPTHTQQTFGDKGEIIGVYCTVKTPSGDYLTEEMDMTTLNKIRDTSKAKNGPWKTWPEEMMRKSVVKRASKYWPKVERLNNAIEMLNNNEGLAEIDITPNDDEAISGDQLKELILLIDEAKTTEQEFANACRVEMISDIQKSKFNAAKAKLEARINRIKAAGTSAIGQPDDNS